MAANIFASWRSGLVNGMNTRHQPLWNLISPTPFRDINYGWIGPIARLSLWLVGLSMLCWMVLWLKISPNPTILQFVAGYETNLLLPANVAVMVAASSLPVFTMPYTVMYAVVPSCTTLAFMHEYSVLAESVTVMNNSADL